MKKLITRILFWVTAGLFSFSLANALVYWTIVLLNDGVIPLTSKFAFFITSFSVSTILYSVTGILIFLCWFWLVSKYGKFAFKVFDILTGHIISKIKNIFKK